MEDERSKNINTRCQWKLGVLGMCEYVLPDKRKLRVVQT